MSYNKTPKVTHHLKTKRPMLQIVQKQNTQDNKKPKFPKLQNVQGYKISPKLQRFGSFVFFLCSFGLVYNIIDKVFKIDATFHSCLYLCGGFKCLALINKCSI